MDAITITCEVCGQPAYVHKAQYKYAADGDLGRPAKEHVLMEVQREIECPTCGVRTQLQVDNKA